MRWLLLLLVAIGALALLVAALVVRQRLLQRGVGTIECGLRLRVDRPGRGWALGVGRCTADDLQWYRLFSLRPRPHRRYQRRRLEVLSSRPVTAEESDTLGTGATVLVCATGRAEGETVELGLPTGALTAFLAWTESAPPDWSGPPRRRRR